MARLARKRTAVDIADNDVSIVAACRLLGMDVPDDAGYGKPVKVRCPFGDIYHSDGGHEASMRVYVDNNTCFCFARCGFFTPVTLIAAAWDLTRRDAAVALLEHVGIREPSLADVWAQAAVRDLPPDRGLLAEALKTFCARTRVDWPARQFDPDVAAILSRCLALLDHVRTPDDADTWLSGCKVAMTRALVPASHP